MADSNDLKAHVATYDSFIATVKWAVPILAILTLFIIFLIS